MIHRRCFSAGIPFLLGVATATLIGGWPAVRTAAADEAHRIQPYSENPRYWQYAGRPVLLLGGSDDDNLFQWSGGALAEQLDLLVSAGGNVIRNTMSSRDEGNLQPFAREGERYDLGRWNEAYWDRFENLLRQTHRREIIVQVELFDPWDLLGQIHGLREDLWELSPWYPDNNVNYTFDTTRLPRRAPRPVYRGGESVGEPHAFFHSVPAVNNDVELVGWQRRFVDRVLEHTLRYDHVLYCISNEIHTEYSPEWGWYWADHLRRRAEEAGTQIEVTEMHWALEMRHPAHRAVLDRPDVYSYFEASQNSFQRGQVNRDSLRFVYEYLAERPRPIHHTKIYGADTGPVWADSSRDAAETFWRNIFGGSASSRFHRPPAGLGLGEEARRHLRSVRMLTDAMDVFACRPHDDLLSDRAENEAYCLAQPGRQYALYFPDGGGVTLDLSVAEGAQQARWLDVAQSRWADEATLEGGSSVALSTPGPGPWAVLVEPQP